MYECHYSCSHCWLQWANVRYIYWHSCVTCAHELIGICCIYVTLERHIYCWPIHGNNVWSTYCTWLCFGINIQKCGSISANSIMVVWLIFVMWQPYLFSDIKYVYSMMGVGIRYICMYKCIHTYTYSIMYVLCSFLYACMHAYMSIYTHMYTEL